MLTVAPPPKNPRFYGSAELVPVSTDRRTVSTLCAPLGGLRPGATKHAALLRRLWAPGAGVQACGSAPLTAHTPKCPAWPGAPVGWDSRSIRLHEPGGRRGKLGNRGSRTPEREVGTSTDAPVALSGVLRGWADCERGPALEWGPRRSPVKRVRWGKDEQESGRSFRRPWAETKQSGLCDDEVSPGGATYFLHAPKIGDSAACGRRDAPLG